MHERGVGLGLTIALAILTGPTKTASADEWWPIEASELRRVDHWQCVTGAPEWVGGERPRRSWLLGRHTVKLAPGRHVAVRLGARATLRVVDGENPERLGQLQLLVSNGSGLRVERDGFAAADEGALFYRAGGAPEVVLVRCMPSSASSAEIALFIARSVDVDEKLPFREIMDLGGEKTIVRREGQAAGQVYRRLRRGEQLELDVPGPSLLSVELHVEIPHGATTSSEYFCVRYRTDSGRSVRRLLRSSDEDDTLISVDGRSRLIGRILRVPVDVRRDESRISLNIDVDALVQVRRLDERPALLDIDYGVSFDDVRELQRASLEFAGVCDYLRGILLSTRLKDGVFFAHQQLREIGRRRLDAARYQRETETILSTGSWFRDLWPRRISSRSGGLLARFVPTKLSGRPGASTSRLVRESFLVDYLRGLPAATFFALAVGKSEPRTYQLPPREYDSELRLIVDKRGMRSPVGLRVSFDDGTVHRLEVLPRHDLETEHYEPASGEAALAVLRWQHGAADAGTLGGPFQRYREPAPLIPAGFATFRLPAGVRSIQLSAVDEGGADLRVALQYRVARAIRLPQDRIRWLIERVGGAVRARSLLRDLVERAGRSSALDPSIEGDLANHWTELSTKIRRGVDLFRASVAPDSAGAGDLVDDEERRRLALAERLAEEAAEEGRWSDVVEIWSPFYRSADAEVASQAVVGLACALRAAGEGSVALHVLRGAIVRGPSALRRPAAECLDRQLLEAGADSARGEALAFVFQKEGRPSDAARLARHFLAKSDFDAAFDFALLAPGEKGMNEVVLRVSLRRHCWSVFLDAVERVEDSGRRAFWRAQHALAKGRYELASRLFRQADSEGSVFADHLERGARIVRSIRSDDIRRRAQAIFEWENWQDRHPGPRFWQEAPSSAVEFIDQTWIDLVGRRASARYFRAGEEQPAVFEVLGPGKALVALRVVGDDDTLERPAWGVIRRPGWRRVVPLPEGSSARSAKIVGEEGVLVGRLREVEIELGPGLHRLEVSPVEGELLSRLYVSRPEFPLGVLPIITPGGIQAAVEGALFDPGQSRDRVARSVGLTVFPEHDHSAPVSVALEPLWQLAYGTTMRPEWVSSADLDLLTSTRIRLRTRTDFGDYPAALWSVLGSSQAISARERAFAAARLGETENLLRRPDAYGFAPPDRLACGAWLEAGRHEEILRRLQRSEVEPRSEELDALEWIARFDEKLGVWARALGQAICDRLPSVDPYGVRAARFAEGLTWQRLVRVIDSAGTRHHVVTGWSPESESLRVRRPLLAHIEPHEQVVVGSRRLVVSRQSREQETLWFDFRLTGLPLSPGVDARVSIRLDGEERRTIDLTRDRPRVETPIRLGPGTHEIRVWVEEPVLGKYLVVGLFESNGELAATRSTSRTPYVREMKRPYHVATTDRPVRASVEGPAWLRIDEKDDRGERGSYRYVPPGTAEILLEPGEDRDESLFRIFRQEPGSSRSRRKTGTADPPAIELPRVRDAIESGELPDLPFEGSGGGERGLDPLREQRARYGFPSLREYLDLAGGGDSTLSFASEFVRRRALEEDEDGESLPDEFFELGITYRKFDSDRETYLSAGAFHRSRFDGSSSVGAEGVFSYKPRRFFGARLEGLFGAVGQWPETGDQAFGRDGGFESSGVARLRLMQRRKVSPTFSHLPSVEVFGRGLSLSVAEATKYDMLDRDVFTPFKAVHRYGLKVSETAIYSPWIDTQLWARVSLMTNEDFGVFSPDSVRVFGGVRQQVGDLRVATELCGRQFFADDHRGDDSFLWCASVRLDYDVWIDRSSRMEIRLAYRYDSGWNDGAINASLVWHFGDGREYRDFRPTEIAFRDLRRRRFLLSQ